MNSVAKSSCLRSVSRTLSILNKELSLCGRHTHLQLRTMTTNTELLKKVYEIVAREGLVSDDYDSSKKVVEFVPPQKLGSVLGGLQIQEDGLEDVDSLLEAIVKYSVKTCHPHFFNQLYHGSDAAGLAGLWLSSALNTNNHTFEVAPVFIVVEKALIDFTKQKLGWTKDCDGITAPGGSIANMYGLMLARHQLNPKIKMEGLCQSQPMVIYTSEDSHYSVLKAANWMGIGFNNVVKVKTDQWGRMIPEELRKAVHQTIEAGKIPMAVNATSGTTVLGAYDDLEAISEVCRSFDPKIWLHVDACWGGSAVMSPKLRGLMRGVDKVDSLAWNPHKMMGAPLQSSIFVTQSKDLLAQCNSASATYLFQQDKFYDVSFDTGDKSVQCGRKVDAFQVWFMLKTRGEKYFAEAVENAFAQADYLAQQVKKREGFEMVVEPHSCTNVCFRYVPRRLRESPDEQEISRLTAKIKEKMTLAGTLMIGYQPLAQKNLGNFFRMVVHGVPHPSKADMDFVLNEIEKFGEQL